MIRRPAPLGPPTSSLAERYTYWRAQKKMIVAHLPALKALGEQSGGPIIEFGTREGLSTTAFLLSGSPVISYDVVETPRARDLERIAGAQWSYRLQDSLTAPVEPCDLLFVDSYHSYAQVKAELERHAAAVATWLVFHDTILYGCIGEDKRSPGIRLAIDELMIRDPTWHLISHDPQSAGLLVLKRHLDIPAQLLPVEADGL